MEPETSINLNPCFTGKIFFNIIIRYAKTNLCKVIVNKIWIIYVSKSKNALL